MPVNTLDYVFTAQPVVGGGGRSQERRDAPSGGGGAYLEYRYLIYDTEAPRARLPRRLRRAAGEYGSGDGQPDADSDRLGEHHFPEREGFQNENMYTTLSYRFPDETSIEELGMSEGAKSKKHLDAGQLGGFQAAVLLVGVHRPGQRVLTPTSPSTRRLPSRRCSKTFTAQMGVPYTPQTEGMTSHSISAPTSTRSSRRSGSRAVRIFIWSVSCRWAGASSDGSTAGA